MAMVEGDEFYSLITHVYTCFKPIIRSKLAQTLICINNKKVKLPLKENLVSSRCIFISHDLWMLRKIEDISSMMAHFTKRHAQQHVKIGMPTTTYINEYEIKSQLGLFWPLCIK